MEPLVASRHNIADHVGPIDVQGGDGGRSGRRLVPVGSRHGCCKNVVRMMGGVDGHLMVVVVRLLLLLRLLESGGCSYCILIAGAVVRMVEALT